MNILKKWIVLCWNIRGMNAKSKQLALMNAINLSGYSVVCLQETKKCDFDDFVFIPSDGASGGLIIIWDSSVFSGMIMHCEPFAVSEHFSSTQSSQSWTLVNIYGPCSGDMRDTFTQWLFNLNIPPDEDWLLLGDFNFIRSPDNRNKPGGNINDILLFNDFIRAQNLTELPIKGRKYTWSNMQDDPLLEQLDRFFTSLHWTSSYPSTLVTPQGKPTSDHIPCVITIQTQIPGSKVFRFENYWIAHPGFLQTVSAS
jgi:exonuclease III